MNEQLELPLECKNEDHIWSDWVSISQYTSISTCNICKSQKYLVPMPSKRRKQGMISNLYEWVFNR